MFIDLRRPVAVPRALQVDEFLTGHMVDNFELRQFAKMDSRLDTLLPIRWVNQTHIGMLSSSPIVEKTADMLILGHTNFNLKRQFLSEEKASNLYRYQHGTSYRSSGIGRKPCTSLFQVAVCTQCVNEGLQNDGFTFWNRLHMQRGVSACDVHGRPLFSICEECDAKFWESTEVRRPSPVCFCKKSLRELVSTNDKYLGSAISITANTRSFANGIVSSKVSSRNLRLAVRETILPSSAGDSGRKDKLRKLLHQTYGAKTLQQIGFVDATIENFIASDKSRLESNPIASIAVIHAVFGGIENLKEVIASTTSRLSENSRYSRLSEGIYISRAQQEFVHRVENLPDAEFKAFQSASRLSFIKAKERRPYLTRSLFRDYMHNDDHHKFLTYFDSDWLAERVPKITNGKRNSEIFTPEIISSFINDMTRNKENSLDRNPFRKITASAIIHPTNPGKSMRILNASSEARQHFQKNVEDRKKWKTRVTKLLCALVKHYEPTHRHAERKRYDGMSHQQFKVQIFKLRRWLKVRGNELKTPDDYRVHQRTKRKLS